MSASNNQPKQHRLQRNLITTVLLLVVTTVIALNRQYIWDFTQVLMYNPSNDVVAMVSKASLSDAGKFTLYATHPQIEDSASFNKDCQRKETGTAVLGCYDKDRIYIYNVTDARLNGIKEVTAAHEMLHAVYQRMSDDERAKINALVEVEFQKLSTNPDFAERMAFYARTEPGERDNELHSIIGTEVAQVSPELEKHYAKYFSDRTKLLALFSGYNSVFVEIDKQAKALSAELDGLSAKIDTSMKNYNSTVQGLNTDIADFNKRATAGGFTSQVAFNRERESLQARVDKAGDMRLAVNSMVSQYERLRNQYNQTITNSNNLYKSIDSTLAPAPSV